MGLVIDSSVLIDAERASKPMLAELEEKHGETEIIISAVSIAELEHVSRYLTNARMIAMFTPIARSLLSTVDSIATSCSVKT